MSWPVLLDLAEFTFSCELIVTDEVLGCIGRARPLARAVRPGLQVRAEGKLRPDCIRSRRRAPRFCQLLCPGPQTTRCSSLHWKALCLRSEMLMSHKSPRLCRWPCLPLDCCREPDTPSPKSVVTYFQKMEEHSVVNMGLDFRPQSIISFGFLKKKKKMELIFLLLGWSDIGL